MTNNRWQEICHAGLSLSDYNAAKTATDNLRRGGESIIAAGKETSIRDIYYNLKLDPKKPVILVPAQFDSDSNVLLFGGNFPQNLDVLKSLLPVAKDCNVIFKQHPVMNQQQREALKSRILHAFPEMFVVDDVKLASLLQICDCIVTRTSGTGLEGLIHHVPVITLGQSIYSHKGLTIDTERREDVPGAVERALAGDFWTPEREWRRMLFFWWLLTEHLFVSAHGEPAEGLHVKSVKRFRSLLGI